MSADRHHHNHPRNRLDARSGVQRCAYCANGFPCAEHNPLAQKSPAKPRLPSTPHPLPPLGGEGEGSPDGGSQ